MKPEGGGRGVVSSTRHALAPFSRLLSGVLSVWSMEFLIVCCRECLELNSLVLGVLSVWCIWCLKCLVYEVSGVSGAWIVWCMECLVPGVSRK